MGHVVSYEVLKKLGSLIKARREHRRKRCSASRLTVLHGPLKKLLCPGFVAFFVRYAAFVTAGHRSIAPGLCVADLGGKIPQQR